jgi:hypothetical protein
MGLKTEGAVSKVFSRFGEAHFKCVFKKSGLQHREDGMKLGNEERTVFLKKKDLSLH